MFPLIDLVVRLFIRFGLIEQDAFFQKHNFLVKSEGYRYILLVIKL